MQNALPFYSATNAVINHESYDGRLTLNIVLFLILPSPKGMQG